MVSALAELLVVWNCSGLMKLQLHKAPVPDRRFGAIAFLLLLGGCETSSLLPATLGAPISAQLAAPPVETYSRIARGALQCWFGAQGSLKKSHIFNADVAPESSGGGAEIVVHERDNAADNPRSFRAYKVAIVASAGGSTVGLENLRMPIPVARDMDADVLRWARGETSCSVVGTGGWAAKPDLSPIETGAVGKKKGR